MLVSSGVVYRRGRGIFFVVARVKFRLKTPRRGVLPAPFSLFSWVNYGVVYLVRSACAQDFPNFDFSRVWIFRRGFFVRVGVRDIFAPIPQFIIAKPYYPRRLLFNAGRILLRAVFLFWSGKFQFAPSVAGLMRTSRSR